MARTIRCYTQSPLLPGTPFKLEESGSHHLCRVLRLRVGDELEVFDGVGYAYRACVKVADPRQAILDLHEQTASPTPALCSIYVAMSLIKPDRFDWMVQKAVELGVSGIIPLETAYCCVKFNAEQRQKKHEHWHNIMIHAAEQCGQNTLPRLSPITTFQTWLTEQAELKTPCLFLDTQANATTPFEAIVKPSQLSLLIGPEGGFHEDERGDCHHHGLIPWHLGPRILRAETAAIAGLTLLQAKFGDI